MSTSIPRCGRMDPHPEHLWPNHNMRGMHTCPGIVAHEGGANCSTCQRVVCNCAAELARERHEEWYS